MRGQGNPQYPHVLHLMILLACLALASSCGGGGGGGITSVNQLPNAVTTPGATSAAAGALRGRLVDEDGNGIADSAVQLGENSWYTVSDSNGYFTFTEIPAGDYLLTAYPDDGVVATGQVPITANQTTDMTASGTVITKTSSGPAMSTGTGGTLWSYAYGPAGEDMNFSVLATDSHGILYVKAMSPDFNTAVDLDLWEAKYSGAYTIPAGTPPGNYEWAVVAVDSFLNASVTRITYTVVTLVSINVTPDPAVTVQGQLQGFTATCVYSNGRSRTCTDEAAWTSTDGTMDPDTPGLFLADSTSYGSVTATIDDLSGTAYYTLDANPGAIQIEYDTGAATDVTITLNTDTEITDQPASIPRPAGTYFLTAQADNFKCRANPSTVTVTSGQTSDIAIQCRPHADTTGHAIPITLTDTTQTIESWFQQDTSTYTDDTDIYSFQAEAGKRYAFSSSHTTYANIRIRDADGSTIEYEYGYSTSIIFNCSTTGTYYLYLIGSHSDYTLTYANYLSVQTTVNLNYSGYTTSSINIYVDSASASSTTSPDSILVDPGTHTITAGRSGYECITNPGSFTAINTGGAQTIAVQCYTTSTSMSSYITLPTSSTFTIGAGIDYYQDYDYFRFTAYSGNTYTFYTTGNTDTKAYLLNSGASTLASNDDSGAGSNFRINWSCTTTGTYYLKIKHYSSYGTGDYILWGY